MDINLLLSDRVNSESRILYNRTPKERVQEVAPWLTVDSNIYPAIVDGRTVWIVDGYTTSNSYPNSQLVNLRNSAADTQSRVVGSQVDDVNYIRNSVKAVVDAYDGTVSLYAWDEADPIMQAYSRLSRHCAAQERDRPTCSAICATPRICSRCSARSWAATT